MSAPPILRLKPKAPGGPEVERLLVRLRHQLARQATATGANLATIRSRAKRLRKQLRALGVENPQ